MLYEASGRVGLWSHRASRQIKRLELGRCRVAQRPCFRRAVVELDAVDVGEEQERVRLEFERQERRGEILVDHRLDAVQAPGAVS